MAKRLVAAMDEITRDIKRVKKITGKKAPAKKAIRPWIGYGIVAKNGFVLNWDNGPLVYAVKGGAQHNVVYPSVERVVRVRVEVME